MKRSALSIAFAMAIAILSATSVFAQFETAEVLGTVHDPSQGAVNGAAVTLTNQETGIEAKTKTDASGDYDFFNVKVGHYTVTIEQAGFEKFSATNISVDVGVRQRVDAELKVGAASETMTVTSQTLLETDTSEHSQVIGTADDGRSAAEWPALRRPRTAGHQRSRLADRRFRFRRQERRAKAHST